MSTTTSTKNMKPRIHLVKPPIRRKSDPAYLRNVFLAQAPGGQEPGLKPPCRSVSEPDLPDLEAQHAMETLRDQSRLLSRLLSKKTELYSYDQITPDPPDQLEVEKESSGLEYWEHEMCTAKEHGGDYKRRLECALRTALGSFLTFSVLVFPHQEILGCVWIGNICMHVNISDSFGASITSSIGFGMSTILVTFATWPVSYYLSELPTPHACILLPFVTFVLSFLVMSCPHLTSPNLMILVMYLVLATPVREDIHWWDPFGWVASYLVSLVIAVLMNIFPLPNFALQSTHGLLERLEKDLTMLLMECRTYIGSTGSDPTTSKAAVATAEMMHSRTCNTVKSLKGKLPATKTELKWLCKGKAADDLEEWVKHTDKLLKPLTMLRFAMRQRVIGEDYSEDIVEAKQIIREQIGTARDRLIDAMIAAVAVCHAWADPSEHRTVLPDVQGELKVALQECREAFHRAMRRASEQLNSDLQENLPVFAHLTRRMSSFSALFALGDSLLGYLEKHSWEAEETMEKVPHKGFMVRLVACISGTMGWWGKEWLWHKKDSFRLALKTSVGMVVASLFISIPYLWNLSKPFGVWPGLTIASVNLATTGSSFHKAADRLFGTLLAAAYALLTTDLFPGNNDYVKIPVITVFTFVLVYVRNADHAYKYTYGATSIGSMLYGSIKNNFNILGYIPKRIELIFCGVLIFTIVELMIFPRSSRKMVEETTFQFFLNVESFLEQAKECAERMHIYAAHSPTSAEYIERMFDEKDDTFYLNKLKSALAKLTSNIACLKKELEAALEEPNVGLTLPLHAPSFRSLVKEQTNCETQATLLVNALENLAGYYKKKNHPIRRMDWAIVHSEILADACETVGYTNEWLTTVYRDGRIRPQKGNSVKAVTAASSFRTLEDCRLRIIAKWSSSYKEFLRTQGFEGSDPVAVMTLAKTTTFIHDLCRHLQSAGLHLEEVAYGFPAYK